MFLAVESVLASQSHIDHVADQTPGHQTLLTATAVDIGPLANIAKQMHCHACLAYNRRWIQRSLFAALQSLQEERLLAHRRHAQ